jgi:iron complex outermembrane receptor protein
MKHAHLSWLTFASLLLLSLSSAVRAEPQIMLDSLLKDLTQYTQLATKQRANVDYVPGMMTVLTQRDLREAGANNVYQALSLVPGVLVESAQNVVVRNLTNSFGSSRLRLMINNESVNNSFLAFSGHFFYIPTEAIERIEIIRGPGVILYGEFAFSGVINVITRKGDYAAVKIGSDNLTEVSLGQALTGKQSQHQWNVSLHHLAGNNSLARDGLAMLEGRSEFSPVNQRIDFGQFSYQGQSEDWRWSLLYQTLGRGDGMGTSSIKDTPNNRTNLMDNSLQWMAHYDLVKRADFQSHVQVNLDQYRFRLKNVTLYPLGLLARDSDPTQEGDQPDAGDIRTNFWYTEHKLEARYESQFNFAQGNQLLLGLRGAFIRISDPKHCINLDPTNAYAYLEQPQCYQQSQAQGNHFDAGGIRNIASSYMQLTQPLSPRITLITGLRMDYYSDLKKLYVSPALAGQLELNTAQHLKMQLTTGTRVPNSSELYLDNNSLLRGNDALAPETIQSLEASFIDNRPSHRWAITGFLNRIEQPISLTITPQSGIPVRSYINGESVSIVGLEAESQWHFHSHWSSQSQLSLQHHSAKGGLEDATSWLADLQVTYQPSSRFKLSLALNADGKVERRPADSREPFDSQYYLNLQTQWRPKDSLGASWLLSIKNLQGKRLKFPTSVGEFWPEDYPHWFNERVIDLTWSKSF